jgi:hypothetical protein
MCSEQVAAQAARTLEGPLKVVAELLVACDDGYRLWQECGWKSGSCSEECGDIREGYVDGAEVVPEVVSCDDRVTALCQGWKRVAGNIARVWTPHVLDRKRGVVHSNRYSSYWAQAVYALDLRPQWGGRDPHQTR